MKIRHTPIHLLLGCSALLHAEPVIQAGDPIIAIDEDISSNSGYPSEESPANVADGNFTTKYLNFGREGSGFIVTPFGGASALRSFIITTANDAEDRDPTSVIISGFNGPIVSFDNSSGDQENWEQIAEVNLNLPSTRDTPSAPINIVNDEAYTSYRVIFPTLKSSNANSMQIAEFEAFDQEDGIGTDIITSSSSVLAIHEATPESSSPENEGPPNLFDGDTSTKYLNFGIENSGFIVTPSMGPSIVNSFQITTANDFDGRDPIGWELFGTNESIVSSENGDGKGEAWVSIASDEAGNNFINPPVDRLTAAPVVNFTNTAEYTSYKFLVRSIRSPGFDNTDSTQYSEFQLFTSDLALSLEIKNITITPDGSGTGSTVTLEWSGPQGLYDIVYGTSLNDDFPTTVAGPITPQDDGTTDFPLPSSNGQDGDVKGFFRVIPSPIN